jgi:hypothetical protein
MKKAILILALFLNVLVATYYTWLERGTSLYNSFDSPDKHFSLLVYSYPQLLGHMPGDSGGGGGYVQLVENRNHQVLKTMEIDAVMLIDTVRWEPASVHIRPFAEWPLPSLVHPLDGHGSQSGASP